MQYLKDFSIFLAQSPYLNLIFLSLAIIGVIVSIFLYFKSKKIKEPRYLYKSFSLIKNSTSSLDGLKIKYQKKKINTLTLTKFSFWNNGKDVIEGMDIAPRDQLRIIFSENTKIINSKVSFTKRAANNITINLNKNEALINFDFLDFGDGVIFELYHTGLIEDTISLKGTIKSVKELKHGEYEKELLTNGFVNTLDELIPPPKNIFLKVLHAITIIPIFIPFLLITLVIDAFLFSINKVPKEYNLTK